VVVEIKFCGLTQPEDAAEAVRLGASYLGVIFAGGVRNVSPATAREVQGCAPARVGRVGVFAASTAEAIAKGAAAGGVGIVQLHGDPTAHDVDAVRARFAGQVWAVVRVQDRLPDHAAPLFDVADAVVLDARVDRALGGTGVAFQWAAVAGAVERARRGRRGRLVVAGGLRPENVGLAIAELAPDVVDVSSGVESAPGIKDHDLMRAFAHAAGAARDR
jgi:phosphoribosylanthranilate isomerase